MHALALYRRGYVNLVPVIPPHAELSPASKIPPSMRGKAPGRLNKQGKWSGLPSWQKLRPSEEEVATFEAQGANIGLNATGFPAIDIDCLDPVAVQHILRLAHEHFGDAPIRVGQAPKSLLVLRTATDFSERRLRFGEHLLECLAGPKRQYLVDGIHPSGTPYRWVTTPLWEWDPSEIPEVTEAQVAGFFDAVAAWASDTYAVKQVGGASLDATPPPQEALLAPDFASLTACVEAIPNDDTVSPDREHYLQMAYAIKAAAGPEQEYEARNLFFAWAGKREPDARIAGNPDTWDADWRRCHPPFRVGWTWLLEQAPNAAQIEFSVEQPPPQPALTELDEQGMLELIAERLHMRLRYGTDGLWYAWTGDIWSPCGEAAQGYVMDEARVLSTRLLEHAAVATSKKAVVELQKRAARVTSLAFISMLTRGLRSRLLLDVTTLDASPWELNTPGGVVNLRDGSIRPARAEDMHSLITHEAPTARPPAQWLRFLEQVTGGDKDLERYLQRFFGYALTGHIYEQKLMFIWGPGGNGKSVLLSSIMHAVGSYAEMAPMDAFASARGDAHPTAIAGLVGKRLVAATETQVGRTWDEAKIKALTGGEAVRTRFMRQDFFTFTPTFTIVLVGNHAPEIRAIDDAMRRRINIVPFTFTPPVVDLFLIDKLRGEAGGILAWLIDGCVQWQREGLQAPESVQLQTRAYFEEEDPIRQWFEESCDIADAFVPVAELYQSWCHWCHRAGEEAGSQKQFTRRVASRLGTKSTPRKEGGRSVRVMLGVALKDQPVGEF